MLSRLTGESFAKNLHTTFKVQVSALEIRKLELVSVGGKDNRSSGRSFDVSFYSKDVQPFGQGTYIVEHARMGSFPLFLVPVGRAEKGTYYQAVFNQLEK